MPHKPEQPTNAIPQGWTIRDAGNEEILVCAPDAAPGGMTLRKSAAKLAERLLYALAQALLPKNGQDAAEQGDACRAATSPMALYHLIVVTPVQGQPDELHRVRYFEYILMATSLHAAYGLISEHTGPTEVSLAPEVWGIAIPPPTNGIVRGPSKPMQSEEGLEQHQHWARVQSSYFLLHQGPESLLKWSERMVQEYCDRNRKGRPAITG